MNERTFMQGYTNFHRKLARSQRVIVSYMLLLLIVNNKTERERERPTQRQRETERETERDRERERQREPRTHNFITKKTDI